MRKFQREYNSNRQEISNLCKRKAVDNIFVRSTTIRQKHTHFKNEGNMLFNDRHKIDFKKFSQCYKQIFIQKYPLEETSCIVL